MTCHCLAEFLTCLFLLEARLPVTPVDDLASALLPNATKPTLLFS